MRAVLTGLDRRRETRRMAMAAVGGDAGERG
jgi:hypothetical protein